MLKNKLWLLQLPVIFAAAAAFLIVDSGKQGDLESRFLRENVFNPLRRVTNTFTDWKFLVRGTRPPKNKVVIVEIDSPSLEVHGRWPWHRDKTAYLIHKAYEAGAKVVGLDMVFSEEDRRVAPELRELLAKNNAAQEADRYETDPVLKDIITSYKDRLVTGWTTEALCQPAYATTEECPVAHPDAIATHPAGFQKFAFQHHSIPQGFDPQKTPAQSVVTFIANIEPYNEAAAHTGSFNTLVDSDGHIRRTSPFFLANQKAYPSLAFEMARVGLGEEASIEFDARHKVRKLAFAKSGKEFPVNDMGLLEINFRGGKQTFPYVSAMDLFSDEEILKDELNRKLAGQKKSDVLKDAYVLIGLSALGVYDMRAFPFDSNVPGVEGHATILDNFLSADFLVPGGGKNGRIWVALVMILGAIGFAYAAQRLESVPALILFVVLFSGLGFVDIKIFFERNINWETSFLYIELLTIFVLTVAAKYVIEERNKKFVRGAFAKYVAPAVVDSILKDPTKLQVGGEKKDLTILFSDIRGFTTFSERMDAKALASFLNDYLGIMTGIVFSNEGTLDKYIGDAIMAFWGAPLDQPKHAANACKAAVAMMKALAENKERFRTQYGVEVNVGVGINTGVVSVGNMGSNQNFAYTVIGDHVNLSSRLEGLTKAYGVSILTTRFTIDGIQATNSPVPAHRVLDHVKVKGKKKAVELIQVLDRDVPDSGMTLFQEGRALYTQKRWDEAIEKFKAADDLLRPAPGEHDGPCEVYLERCEEFKRNPPAEDWDGSWEMHSK